MHPVELGAWGGAVEALQLALEQMAEASLRKAQKAPG